MPADETPQLDIHVAAPVDGGDGTIPDFDFEKFLNDFGATPGSLGEGFIAGPSADASGAPAAALTPRFDDMNLAMSSTNDFNFDMNSVVPNEPPPAVDQVKLASLRSFFYDAKELYTEVENWEDPVTPENREARVLVGNKTHKLALQVCTVRVRGLWRVVSYSARWTDHHAARHLPRPAHRRAGASVCGVDPRPLSREFAAKHGGRVCVSSLSSVSCPFRFSSDVGAQPYMARDYCRMPSHIRKRTHAGRTSVRLVPQTMLLRDRIQRTHRRRSLATCGQQRTSRQLARGHRRRKPSHTRPVTLGRFDDRFIRRFPSYHRSKPRRQTP